MKHMIEDDTTEAELPEGTVIMLRGGYRYVLARRLPHNDPRGFMWKPIADSYKHRTRHRREHNTAQIGPVGVVLACWIHSNMKGIPFFERKSMEGWVDPITETTWRHTI